MFRLLMIVAVLLPGWARAQQSVVIAEADGVRLQARLYLPSGGAALPLPGIVALPLPGIVALHGCGGPLPRRDDGWARILAAQGHVVLLPDSFSSRGLQPECRQTTHGASAYGPRRDDALAAAAWLQARAGTPPGGVLLLGWSDGGTTILASIGPGLPPGLIRGAVAFYPACTRTLKRALNQDWHAGAPLLILMGAADDWTPPAPCQALAQGEPAIAIRLFPGAYHDFDVPDDPVHIITGLPYTKGGAGVAHAGENPAARALALQLVPVFFAMLKPGPAR